MDVFHVGASAPKAPGSKSVERAEPGANGPPAPAAGSDAYASSADGAAVARHVAKLSVASDVRDEVLRGISELLGQGSFDTPDSARRAAQGILDS
jgi:hypothetical protein